MVEKKTTTSPEDTVAEGQADKASAGDGEAKAAAAPKKRASRRAKGAGNGAAKKKPARKPRAKKSTAKKEAGASRRGSSSKGEASSAARDRRRHPRAELRLLVQHRFETVDDFVKEVATNISAGGLFLQTEQPHAEGSTVYLRFALQDGLPLIEGIGRVVRVNAAGHPGRVPGMGIEFISLDDESRQLIDTLVLERFSSEGEAEQGEGGSP